MNSPQTENDEPQQTMVLNADTPPFNPQVMLDLQNIQKTLQNFPHHLFIDLAKNCMEVVNAILALGVPLNVAQQFAKEFPQQFGERIGEATRFDTHEPTPHWLEDTCVLIQHIENPSEADKAQMAHQTWGWQETPPPLTSEQLQTALTHGAALQHHDTGFDLFQRMELNAEQLHVLTQCVDVLAVPPKAAEGHESTRAFS
jgi:hypothetical protein